MHKIKYNIWITAIIVQYYIAINVYSLQIIQILIIIILILIIIQYKCKCNAQCVISDILIIIIVANVK